MPTSRRRVVTQQKKRPPVAHWRSTVETWRRTSVDLGPSADHGEVPGRRVEALGTGLGGHDDVLDAGSAAAGQVDPGFDGEGVARPKGCPVARHQVRILVLLQADAVAGAVHEELAVAGAVDDRPGGGVDVLAGDPHP